MLRKIEYLAINKNVGTPKSKLGDKKKKKSPTSSVASQSALGAIGSTTMFQMVELNFVYLINLHNRCFKNFCISSIGFDARTPNGIFQIAQI